METKPAVRPIRLDPRQHSWMRESGLVAIWDLIEAGGGEMRVVGGAVRDALLGRDVHDVDLAVNLPPDQVSALLRKGGLRVVPTGIAHGTVTVVSDHKGYEITTLRHDVLPDGRRSKVVFTDNWQLDAARRDFTFNALYADRKGKIYDYFDGQRDLQDKRLRFIGHPQDRIREDVLRILRFFRFYAQIDDSRRPTQADPESYAACCSLSPLLPNLSAERIGKEMARLFQAAHPAAACKLMADGKILQPILPELRRFDRLYALLELEPGRAPPSFLRRLAAVLEGDPLVLARKLRLSKVETQWLQVLSEALDIPGWGKGLTPFDVRQKLYFYGPEKTRDALLLLAAVKRVSLDPSLAVVAAWTGVAFPLKGKDIQSLGIGTGPVVGEVLKRVEMWWQAHDFMGDKAACLAYAKSLLEDGAS